MNLRKITVSFPGVVLVEMIFTPMHIPRPSIYWHNASLEPTHITDSTAILIMTGASPSHVAGLRAAMEAWQSGTCLRFVEQNISTFPRWKSYVEVIKGTR